MRKGLTLLELLIAIAIVFMLIGLLLPIIKTVRKNAYRSSCSNNLRQLGSALEMYRQDYRTLPDYVQLTVSYVRDSRVYLCPADPLAPEPGADGIGNFTYVWNRYGVRQGCSYAYLPLDAKFRARLEAADPNHGVLACALHARCDQKVLMETTHSIISCFDHLLRLRLDGSIQWVSVPMRYYHHPEDPPGVITGERDTWRIFSDVPCPPDICIGGGE